MTARGVADFVGDHGKELVLGPGELDSEFFVAAAFEVLPDLRGDAGQQRDEGVLGVFAAVAADQDPPNWSSTNSPPTAASTCTPTWRPARRPTGRSGRRGWPICVR